MTQNTVIWKLVSELLHFHDCVIIPGFGGFVCNREPARIDQVSHVILPPGKRIIFNQNLKSNDGLLAGFLAKQEQINYSESLANIESFVNQIQQELTEKKQFLIDGFGTFRLNAEANYVFVPDSSNTFLFSSYGLTPLQAGNTKSKPFKERRTRILNDQIEVNRVKRRRIKNLGPKALVLTLLVMLATNGWIYFKENPVNTNQFGQAGLSISNWFDSIFNPEDTQNSVVATPQITITPPLISVDHQPTFVPKLNVDSTYISTSSEQMATPVASTYNYEALAMAFSSETGLFHFSQPISEVNQPLANPDVTDNNNPVEDENAEEPTSVVPVIIAGKWFIIGGVFCHENNAKRFKNKLVSEGYHAEILPNSSIHCLRVSYASYNTKHEAESALTDIQKNVNPEAWICSSDAD